MHLDLLAAREIALLQRLDAGPEELVRGEQKGAIQEEFGGIYTACLAVIRQESQPLEALKRAMEALLNNLAMQLGMEGVVPVAVHGIAHEIQCL
jgi:hypothetical protein